MPSKPKVIAGYDAAVTTPVAPLLSSDHFELVCQVVVFRKHRSTGLCACPQPMKEAFSQLCDQRRPQQHVRAIGGTVIDWDDLFGHSHLLQRLCERSGDICILLFKCSIQRVVSWRGVDM